MINVGDEIGRLTVVEDRGVINRRRKWLCTCSCGNNSVVSDTNLKKRRTKSCGCLQQDNRTSHGLSQSSVYDIWVAIKQRCYNERNSAYANYGGRGITMHKPWYEDFTVFSAYVGERPSGYSIDRIDNNSDYVPGNIRWATRFEQNRNTRHNKLITYTGQTKPLVVWCEELQLPYDTMSHRISRYKWSAEKAFETPVQKRVAKRIGSSSQKTISYKGQDKSLGTWCDELHLSYPTIQARLDKAGWSIEKAFETPIRKWASRLKAGATV